MASLVTEQEQWFDQTTNTPIVDGFIFIGERNASPRTSKTIFSDRELTDALANPQRTDSAGRSVNKIWTEGRYSIEVADSDDVQKYIELDAGESDSAGVTTLGDVQGSNTITATASNTITGYVDLQQYVFRTILINTGPITLNIDSVGAKAIIRNQNKAITANEFKADQNIVVTYNLKDDVFEWANQNSVPGSLVSIQIVETSADYVIPDGLVRALVRCIAPGGGAGGAQGQGASTFGASSGGSGGVEAWSLIERSDLDAADPITMTIGAKGIGGIGFNPGSKGGTTSFGSLVTADGGNGSPGRDASANASFRPTAAIETGGTGDVIIPSQMGGTAEEIREADLGVGGGNGGNSSYGVGGRGLDAATDTGADGTGKGSGGAGVAVQGSGGGARPGGDGTDGQIVIREFFL